MVCIQKKSQSEVILEEISNKRELMMDCANKNGFTYEETIRYSQELDELINKYQRICNHTSTTLEETRFSLKQMILGWQN
jgi:stage 0 sporulation regulatory protein